jgi:hypothetical protein
MHWPVIHPTQVKGPRRGPQNLQPIKLGHRHETEYLHGHLYRSLPVQMLDVCAVRPKRAEAQGVICQVAEELG